LIGSSKHIQSVGADLCVCPVFIKNKCLYGKEEINLCWGRIKVLIKVWYGAKTRPKFPPYEKIEYFKVGKPLKYYEFW
jgi:hypothetical protein